MKKMMRRVGALAASVIMALSCSMSAYADKGYTYNYDYWGDVQYSPDAYTVAKVFTSAELGLDKKLNLPNGLFVLDKKLYICDTGNNRIIELERTETDKFTVVRYISDLKGNTDKKSLSGPTDVAVTEDGFIYVCDNANERVVKMDSDLNVVLEFTKPTDNNFDQDLSFLPTKLIVDKAGRVYCIATNVNKGLIKFEPDGEFSGFVGATEVSFDLTDWFYKKIATKEQREQLLAYVPTEYSNINVDHDGFIYAVASNISQQDIGSGKVAPVRKLNLLGSDILVRNGWWDIIGEQYFDAGGGYEGPSRFVDVTSFKNDVYTVLDKNRGRIFSYDDQGRMLWAFGGAGNADGYFKQPVALEHMDYDLIVLDQINGSITLFTPTEFGKMVYRALDQFQSGNYVGAGESWNEVAELNGNYDLAYIGIGRSLLRQKKYKEAMEYFELKYDTANYSKAYKQYRKQWVEEHIGGIALVMAILIIAPLLYGRLKKIKFEIDLSEMSDN